MKVVVLSVTVLVIGALLVGAVNNFYAKDGVGGGGGGGWADPSLSGAIVFIPGGRLHPAVDDLTGEPAGGISDLLGRLFDFLIGCMTDGCVVTNQPVGGGGGGGYPSCQTCNMSGPPGTTAGGGGGWARKVVAPSSSWSWFSFLNDKKE